jgi:RNA polymerase sigma-70 factor (ECF subfamily)
LTFDDALEIAAAAWPTLPRPSTFLDYLRDRVPAGAAFEDWLEHAPIADCYLACACAAGSEPALALFDSTILCNLAKFLSSMRPSPDFLAEVAQTVREKLFVAAANKRPKIAEYLGMGTLTGWVRVVSVRTAIDLKRLDAHAEHHVEFDDQRFVKPSAEDQELAHLKARYRDQLNEALRRAIGVTSHEQRNLLRLHFVEGFTFDELAHMFKMHKVTVWRKMAAARDAVVECARDILKLELNLPSDEFDSLMRVLESQIDVSLLSYFKVEA